MAPHLTATDYRDLIDLLRTAESAIRDCYLRPQRHQRVHRELVARLTRHADRAAALRDKLERIEPC